MEEKPNPANRLQRSGLLWPEQEPRADFGGARAAPREELDLHHIPPALRSSQLEHSGLENGPRWSQSLQGFTPL